MIDPSFFPSAGIPLGLLAVVDPWILTFSALTVFTTIGMGIWSAKKSKTSKDFFVAGRSVSVGWNASAISGEYLSAASFMGVAGMVMTSGYDALWYPACYACGYLFLLLFIAGPLRRFGAYTIPDFAEGRFDSPIFRKIAVIFVLFIGFFYTMPQMKGAGTTLAYIFPDMPYWGGVVLVGAVITFNVALGGMKGITLVQAFQYWVKMFAISLTIIVLMGLHGYYHEHLRVNDGRNGSYSVTAATVTPTGDLKLSSWEYRDVERRPLPEKAPYDTPWISPFGPLTTKAAKAAGLSVREQRPYSLLYTYSLIIALVCGTAGLPHILVRFYTNPDGVAAKKTTMWVMVLIGIFYLFPPIFGVLGRDLMPQLYQDSGVNGPDGVVLKLPKIVNEYFPGWGSVLSGITCAGAFAAFMSTFSGLLISMTGALAHDVYGRILRPQATQEQRLRAFKISAVLIGVVAILLGTLVENFEINFMVGQAFAIAASSYFPLLFMSIWWRGITMKGAVAGMLGGGLAALFGISLTSFTTFILAMDAKFKTGILAEPGWFNHLKALSMDNFWAHHPLLRILCEQPAIWAVPLAIILMIVVSKLTAREIPADVREKMVVLHAPEKLGLKQEYIQEHSHTH